MLIFQIYLFFAIICNEVGNMQKLILIKYGELTTKKGNRNTFIKLLVRNRSEEHTSELQSLVVISYAVFCLKKIFF